MLNKRIIYVTGLPRSGSTLLCQLLGHHEEIYSCGHSSPLCQTLNSLRYNLSDNQFLLSQLDVNFNLTYERLVNAFRGFINGWFAETEKTWVVDKNRGWLHHLETVNFLDPNFRMLVCVRELGQIYGSIESQHQKTLLLDFPDHLASFSRWERADKLFDKTGVVGAPLNSIKALQDIDTSLQQHLYYVVFEHLIGEPVTVMQDIYQWLGLSSSDFDPQNLRTKPHESDSHYRFKYLHKTYEKILPPTNHLISSRIQKNLRQKFTWFYNTFYPNNK
ncbi:MAG: sulfotransferase [Cyanobacteria bacterium P01_D01_bin.50]